MKQEAALSIELQPRDFEILRGLFESRVMTLAHVGALYFGGKLEAAKKRLQKLKAAGLVNERPRKVYEPAVLFLTRLALTLLTKNGHLANYPQIGVADLDKRAQVSPLTLHHELEVMDVKAAMVSAISALPKFNLVEFTTWPLLNQFKARRPNGEPITIKPDGFIRVQEEDTHGLLEHTFYLEVDRSTEAQEVLGTRAACYLDYYRRGGLAIRNGRTPEEFKDFPFRVLMVFKNAERRNNTAERLLNGSPPILTQVWLTTYAEATTDPLSSIWIRPLDYRNAIHGTRFDAATSHSRTVYRRVSEREDYIERSVDKYAIFST